MLNDVKGQRSDPGTRAQSVYRSKWLERIGLLWGSCEVLAALIAGILAGSVAYVAYMD
jgi:hypothetical protein